MARPKFKGILDLGNPDTNRRCRNWIAARKGLYRIAFEPAGNTRTNRQLAWWWPCVIGPLYEFLKENDTPGINCEEDAHDMVCAKFLTVPTLIDPRTGEALAWRVRRTGELEQGEWQEFTDRVRAWMATDLGIDTDDPDREWREHKRDNQKQLTAANAADREDSYANR